VINTPYATWGNLANDNNIFICTILQVIEVRSVWLIWFEG